MTSSSVDFALLGHPSGPDHLDELIVHSRPDFDREKLRKHRATFAKLFEWTPTYAAGDPIVVAAGAPHERRGQLVVCTFLPDVIDSPGAMVRAYQKVREGCALARDAGARIVGLGGFTSIVGGATGLELAESFGLRITSGNTLTAALAVAQVQLMLVRLGWDRSRTLAVIGASGDIGGACALALASDVRRIIVIGRNPARIETVARRLARTYVTRRLLTS